MAIPLTASPMFAAVSMSIGVRQEPRPHVDYGNTNVDAKSATGCIAARLGKASCAQKHVLAGTMSARALRSLNSAVTAASSSGASPRASRQSFSPSKPHMLSFQRSMSTVDFLGFFDMALLKEQSTQDVANGLHLAPWFVVSEIEGKGRPLVAIRQRLQ